MIVPAILPLTAYRNGYASWDIQLLNAKNKQPLDLTGCEAEQQVRYYQGAPGAPFISVNSLAATPNGSIITFTTPASGMINILYRLADIENFPVVPPTGAQFWHDILITQPGLDPAPFVIGIFNFSDGVTVPDL